MPGRHLPPDPSRGDESTLGGYLAVHDRPAAFEGSDGLSYSVEIMTEPTGEADAPWGAYLLFLRWRRVGAQGVDGHLETEFLVRGATEPDARARLGAIPLRDVKETLEGLLRRRGDDRPARRWWDVMRDESSDA